MKHRNNAFLTGKDSVERKKDVNFFIHKKFVVNLLNTEFAQKPSVEKDIQKTVDTLIKASA